MAQTRRQSLNEAFANILVGYTVNMMANFTIFPWFGWVITMEQNLLIGVFYTIISLVRSYGLRRFYNWYHGRERCKISTVNDVKYRKCEYNRYPI